MQTSINENMAFGIPGTHANTQPWFADPVIAATDVTFGGLAGKKSDGAVGIMDATYSTFIGIFVNPNEHVRQVLPSSTASLAVKAGETVAVAKKGSWFIAQPTAVGATLFKKGDKLKVDTSTYVLAVSTSADDTIVAEVIDGTTEDNCVAIRLA